jgi:uncharacterized membrane protein
MTQAETGTNAGTGEQVRRGSWKRRGCGCFAFFLGAGATLVAFAPLLFGRMVMESFVEEANQQIAGELEIGDVALSWTGTQRLEGLRLRDPEGRTVAEFDLEMPSFWQLAYAAGKVNNGEHGDYGKIFGTVELALVTGPDVPSNLERALASRFANESRGKSAGSSGRSSEEPDEVILTSDEDGEWKVSLDSAIQFADLEIEFQVKHFSWSDPRLDEDGRAIGVKDLIARLVFEAEQPASLTVRGEHLYGESRAPLSLDASIEVGELFGDSGWQEALSGVLEIDALPTPVFDRLSEANGELVSALGASFDVDARLDRPQPDGQRLTAAVGSELQSLSLDARLVAGMLRIAEDAPMQLDLRVPSALLEAALVGELPEGVALVADDGRSVPVAVLVDRFVMPLSADAGWQSAELGLRVSVPAIGVDVTGRESIGLRDGALTIAMTPDGPLALEFEVREQGGGRLGLELRLPPGWQAAVDAEAPAEELDYRMRLTVNDLPVERALAFSSANTTLADHLTEPIQLVLRAQAGDGASTLLELEADSGGNQLRFAGVLDEDTVVVSPGTTQVTLGLTTDQLVALSGESWPEGYELTSPSGRVRAQVILREARWSLEESLGTAKLEARLGPLTLTDEALRAASQSIALQGIELTADLDSARVVELDSSLTLDADAGSATAHVKSAETLQQLVDGAEPTWSIHLRGEGLDTRIVDILAAQDGLLLDVFGPQLELDIEVSDLRDESARVQARLDSANAQLAWSGRLDDGVLLSEGDAESLDASVGITPLFQERIVGNLLPVLVGMESVEGAEPALVHVSNFRMPLSAGDRSVLAGLQADVRLALGEVRCAVLPDLAGMLSSQVHQLRPTTLPTIQLKIRDGVVVADELPIEIEKTRVVFKGNYALVDERMEFTCSVPLAGLRGDVGRVLNEAREYLDPQLSVPLSVRGRPNKPQVGIDSAFLKQVVRDGSAKAAEDALEKGLRKLFGND